MGVSLILRKEEEVMFWRLIRKILVEFLVNLAVELAVAALLA
jgi:hypothetical protein